MIDIGASVANLYRPVGGRLEQVSQLVWVPARGRARRAIHHRAVCTPGKQRALPSILALNEALHSVPPHIARES